MLMLHGRDSFGPRRAGKSEHKVALCNYSCRMASFQKGYNMSRKRTAFALLMLCAMSAVLVTSKVSVKGSEGEPGTFIGNDESVSLVDDLNSRTLFEDCDDCQFVIPGCDWDLNCDFTVNVTDLLILLAQFDCECVDGDIVNCGAGSVSLDCRCAPGTALSGDFNDDHIVDGADLDLLLDNWGSCP